MVKRASASICQTKRSGREDNQLIGACTVTPAFASKSVIL
jgi:hypothetical protein